jgi:chromosome condensin MukBEF ATPase and DNA-binding subunit MukB
MEPQAKVSSLDALDAFRSSLILYLERARHILDDVRHEVIRTRAWLEQDRQPYWKKQIRLRAHALAQAEQELLTARLSEQPEVVRDRRRAVDRAKAQIQEAEAAFDRARHWLRQYDRELDPHSKSTQSLRQLLDLDLVNAVALLAETTRVLADYAERAPGRNLGSVTEALPGPVPPPDTPTGRLEGGAS